MHIPVPDSLVVHKLFLRGAGHVDVLDAVEPKLADGMAREQLVVHAANRLFVQVKKVEGAIGHLVIQRARCR